ncbi:WD40 repeat domain-containing protein [Rhodotorula paludigena]|uniref:WD40 repeat domain-containing protein n=1 Tax=Rhodotorula paludigena TaxID=86838 RepID=UPI0031818264
MDPPADAGQPRPPAQPSATAMMSSDELDWLLYAYLEESGYHHTSFSLLHESHLAGPSTSSAPSSATTSPQPNGRADSSNPGRNPVMDTVVPPGHLVRLLQKGLLYLEAEARYRGDPAETKPRIVGYTIPETLPLPPLPKYVPPLEPSPPPAAAPAPSDAKGKGKAKEPPVSAVASTSTAASAPAAASKRKAGGKDDSAASAAASTEAEAGSKRPRTTSAESGAGTAAAKKGKGKEREREAGTASKGKGKAKDEGPDPSGDVSMEDAAPVKAKDAQGGSKGKERERDAGSSAGAPIAPTKREREKDDLRPPPAKKSASSAPSSSAAPSAGTAAASSSAAASASTASQKRSASPTVSRKPKSSASASSSAAADPAAPSSTSSAAPTTPAPAPPPNKFRITTTTKTVTTPAPAASSSSAALAAAAAAARRRGSGDSASTSASAGADERRPPKLKTDVEAAGSSAASGSGSGSGHSGKNGVSGPKSPAKAPSPLKDQYDMRGVRIVKSEDRDVVRLKGHSAKVQPCAFNSKVPSLLATGGNDSTCRIWDVPSPSASSPSASQQVVTEHMRCKHSSNQRRVDITAVAWDPSGSLLATATEDGIARIWTVSGDLHLVLSMHQRSITALKWSPSGTMILTGSLDQTVCLWEVSSGKVRQQFSTHSDQVLDVDWNDDTMFASASSDRLVHLMSTSRPTPLHRFRGHRDDVNVVKFSPCGTLVASCADDTTVRVWSLRNIGPIAREIAAKPVKKGDAARKIDAEADDDEQPGGGGGVWVLEGHESDVHQIAWHPTAGKEGSTGPRLLASCSFDSTAKLWDADAGTCLYTFTRSTDFVYSIAFEPSLGRYLATGSNDGKLDIWRVKDYTLLTEYTQSAAVYELTWHPQGKQLAVCGDDHEVAVVPLLLPASERSV